MSERSSDEIIDEFIREKFGEESFGMWKTLFKVAFMVGRLDVVKFAKDAGVSEDAVRRHFGDDDTDESEEAAESDTVDDDDDESTVAKAIFLNHVGLLEADADDIFDCADRSSNKAIAYTSKSNVCLLDQLNAINHQLNILIHIIAVHVKGGC